MKRIFNEPLIHFVLIDISLLAVFDEQLTNAKNSINQNREELLSKNIEYTFCKIVGSSCYNKTQNINCIILNRIS